MQARRYRGLRDANADTKRPLALGHALGVPYGMLAQTAEAHHLAMGEPPIYKGAAEGGRLHTRTRTYTWHLADWPFWRGSVRNCARERAPLLCM